ncbi:MAG: radical SAM family heme chaperone HemW [Candidatus Hydrogenedentota bacterium]
MMHLYIHIPFCKKKCNYCDFYSIPVFENDNRINIYLDSLFNEFRKHPYVPGETVFQTVYIGGGNPGLLNTSQLDKILKILPTANAEEISIELNPDSVSLDKIKILKENKVNRFSFGLQTTEDNELKFLGRTHTFFDFKKSYELAKKLGFNNINVDLIYGFPGQSIESFIKSLNKVIDLQPEHLSVYEFSKSRYRDWYQDWELDEGMAIKMWDEKIKILSAAGFKIYEISNFCIDGFECKHNLGIWNGEDYLGLGASAHSRIKYKRWDNVSNVDIYIKKNGIAINQSIDLTKKDLIFEYILLGLRTTYGINRDRFKSIFDIDIVNYLKDIIAENIKYFNINPGYINLKLSSFSIYDTIIENIYDKMFP